MADKKNYYYLKIKENFFNTEDIKLLESTENGYLYSNILMKMYLLSLKNGGKLMYKDTIPYNSKMLSTILNHNIDILDKAIKVFTNLGLIEVLDSGAIFMLDIQNYIGKSSDEADRIRRYRSEISTEKQALVQMYDECTTDVANTRDRDITRVIDKKKEIYKEKKVNVEVEEILEYLNLKASTKYKTTSKETIKLINARMNDGFTIEDFRTVIDKKCFEWINTDYEKFLRPATLFSNKFESYLNQKQKVTLKNLPIDISDF